MNEYEKIISEFCNTELIQEYKETIINLEIYDNTVEREQLLMSQLDSCEKEILRRIRE